MNADDLADDYQPRSEDSPFTLTVDGELFTVTLRPDGGEDFTWETGPNEGYGFGGGPVHAAGDPSAEPPLLTLRFHRRAISDFLSSINPETGYLD
ncbi:hypothetical protein B2J88_50795 [Rhodococcus sp. SRB_17]|nr:hypothetical protein [Rhodococcus sp. SRB_17]